MAFDEMTLRAFSVALGGKDPVPGGGGASALAGALGAALGRMVGALTVGKKKYAGVEADIRALMEQATTLQEELLALIDGDAAAFAPLAAAYGMPAETEAQRIKKAEVMESALLTACSAPLSIMEACCRTLDLLQEFAEKGSRIAVSDAGVGAALCRGALTGASLNVFINTKAMVNRETAETCNAKANEMLADYTCRADAIIATVREKLA